MTIDALILACPQDRAAAARLTDGLGAAGLAALLRVAEDGDVPVAGCTVLVLTEAAACDPWMVAQASSAAENGRAIAVQLERGAVPPLSMPSYDYPASGIAARLLEPMRLSVIAGAVRAVQRNTQPPSAPLMRQLLLSRLWKWGVGLGALATFFGIVQGFGIDIWPRWNEEDAYSELVRGNGGCAPMNAFIKKFPDGRYATRVRDALVNPVAETRQTSEFYPLTISGPSQIEDGPTSRNIAVTAANEWGVADADRQCASLTNIRRGLRYEVRLGTLNDRCVEIGGRWQCTVDGEGDCEVIVDEKLEVCRLTDHR